METTILEVKLRDEGNNETILKIDNPREDVTFEGIQTAFNTGFASKLIYSRYGRPFDAVLDASIVKTTRTSLTKE